MTKAVLILAPDEATGRLSRALSQSNWTVHTAATVCDVGHRVAKTVTAILAPIEQYREATELVSRLGTNAKVIATMPFSDPSGEESAIRAGAFSVLNRPLAPSEVLQVLAFASSRHESSAHAEMAPAELHGAPA